MSDYRREAGVLCHISSLPGKYGIGSLGKAAYRFAEKLAKCGVGYWQILPLVQTGYGDSPYSSVACNSGNPYFIDLETLQKQKLLTSAELKGAEVAAGNVDYGMLYATRYPLLRRAFSRFNLDGEGFRAFVKQGEYEDYALYMTAKTVYGDRFSAWPEQIRRRDPAALESLRTSHHEEYLFWQFLQYEFRRQWNRLRDYANGLGVSIIGDIPLYVAADSADAWALSPLVMAFCRAVLAEARALAWALSPAVMAAASSPSSWLRVWLSAPSAAASPASAASIKAKSALKSVLRKSSSGTHWCNP